MLKRGIVVGVAAGAGLLALAGVALAGTKKPSGGGGGKTQEQQDLCVASQAERTIAAGNADQLRASLIDLDAARIQAADAEEWDSLDALNKQRATIVGQINKFDARVKELDTYIEENC